MPPTAAPNRVREPEPPHGLDPQLARLIEALAAADVERDYARAMERQDASVPS